MSKELELRAALTSYSARVKAARYLDELTALTGFDKNGVSRAVYDHYAIYTENWGHMRVTWTTPDRTGNVGYSAKFFERTVIGEFELYRCTDGALRVFHCRNNTGYTPNKETPVSNEDNTSQPVDAALAEQLDALQLTFDRMSKARKAVQEAEESYREKKNALFSQLGIETQGATSKLVLDYRTRPWCFAVISTTYGDPRPGVNTIDSDGKKTRISIRSMSWIGALCLIEIQQGEEYCILSAACMHTNEEALASLAKAEP